MVTRVFQLLVDSKDLADQEMERWKEVESTSKSLSDWLDGMEAEHRECTQSGAEVAAVKRLCDGYENNVAFYRSVILAIDMVTVILDYCKLWKTRCLLLTKLVV